MKLKCFNFSNGEKKDEPQTTKSSSLRSNSTLSTDHGIRRSSSGFDSQNISNTSSDSLERPQYPSFSKLKPSNLRVFTFSELKNATKNFSPSLLLGEGGFGCVYRGVISNNANSDQKIEIAVKQLSRKGSQGHKEWLTEVNVLGIVDHPNLVKLIGYCADDDERGIQRLLVYEYMHYRSVMDHLSPKSIVPLPWNMRLKIALDAARGLTYLHEEMEFQIIFRDFKTSNMLLDEKWNAKLSDFGFARQGPEGELTHVSTAVVGTIGYAAPEYMQTGHLTAKSDIWSYGVVLYELITGRPPIDRNRPRGEQKLLEWLRPYVSDPKKFHMVLDPRIDTLQAMNSAQKLSAIANKCLVGNPRSRPKMSRILEMVQILVDDENIGSNPMPELAMNIASKEKEVDAVVENEAHDLKRRRELGWRDWTAIRRFFVFWKQKPIHFGFQKTKNRLI